MEHKDIVHFLHVPFTGLGRYNGFRGNRWLRNRIKIFKQFVIPSLHAQTSKNFILWCAWRYEEQSNPQIKELKRYLDWHEIPNVFTYAGIAFWDDKYPDDVAYTRLVESVHRSMGPLLNLMGEAEEVLMTIQPSDDCYHKNMVIETQEFFAEHKDIHALGYQKGYVMDYLTLRLAEWNPTTTPPFYTIRFPRETFVDPLKHMKYIGPYKSHEFVKDYLPSAYEQVRRCFIVGTHQSNISTVFDHPFTGKEVDRKILKEFGLEHVEKLKISCSLRGWVFHRFPYQAKKKLRYWAEKNSLFAGLYNFLRG